MMKKLYIYILFVCSTGFAQDVYYHVNNTELYSFIDEMASVGYIEVNTSVKPYTRVFISDRLNELANQKEKPQREQQIRRKQIEEPNRRKRQIEMKIDLSRMWIPEVTLCGHFHPWQGHLSGVAPLFPPHATLSRQPRH